MPADNLRYNFRIPSPTPFLSEKEKIDRLTQDLNTTLLAIRSAFRNLIGGEGISPPFEANLDLNHHKIINLARPTARDDATSKVYVDELLDEVKKTLEEILLTIHNELPPTTFTTLILRRAIPTTVNNMIELGNFLLTNDAHALDVAAVVSDASFSVAKRWLIVTNRSINADWQEALPITDTGPGSSQDFALDVKQVDADSKVYLRLRRTAGTTAGTATIRILQLGAVAEVFNETTATGAVSAPTTFLESAILTVLDGNVLVNTKTPGQLFAGFTNMTLSGSTAAGIYEVITQAADADGLQVGQFTGSDRNSVAADKRLAIMEVQTEGSTANNRGGRLRFFTKADGGVVVLREVLDRSGNHGVGGATTFGASAAGTFALKNGTAPTTNIADQHAYYSADNAAAVACPTFRPEDGLVVQLFRGVVLTVANALTIDLIYDANERDTITNLRTRVNEIETRLQALGLLA